MNFVPYIIASFSLIFSLYQFFSRENKEEVAHRKAMDKEVEARITKLEQSKENHDLRLQGIVQQHEREADNTTRRFDEIMSELSKLPALYTSIATVSTDVKHLATGISDIKATLNTLHK